MATTIKPNQDGLISTSTESKTSWYPGKCLNTNSNIFEKPLLLTKEATELDVAMDDLAKVCKKLCDQLDDLTDNIKKLTEENNRLKDALGIVESSPMKDLEKILNEK